MLSRSRRLISPGLAKGGEVLGNTRRWPFRRIRKPFGGDAVVSDEVSCTMFVGCHEIPRYEPEKFLNFFFFYLAKRRSVRHDGWPARARKRERGCEEGVCRGVGEGCGSYKEVRRGSGYVGHLLALSWRIGSWVVGPLAPTGNPSSPVFSGPDQLVFGSSKLLHEHVDINVAEAGRGRKGRVSTVYDELE